MLTAEATVATSRASRYLTQLCRHADQMRRIRHRASRNGDEQMPPVVERVEYSSTAGTVRFAEGMLHVRATANTLTLRIEAADEHSLHRLKNGIARRLRTIGRRDGLALTWHDITVAAEPDSAQEQTPQPARRNILWRGRLGAIALIAAGALIVALHLGLGGAALAASAWTGWIVNSVLIVIVGTAVVVSAHVIAGRFAYRSGKTIHARWKLRRLLPHTSVEDTNTNGEHT